MFFLPDKIKDSIGILEMYFDGIFVESLLLS